MTDRPIIFSAPMIRALLAGRKTQTRRVLKPQPDPGLFFGHMTYLAEARKIIARNATGMRQDIPLSFAPGDRLWVREAWRTMNRFDALSGAEIAADAAECEADAYWSPVHYEADGARVNWIPDPDTFGTDPGRYRHARFMPRWASRLTLTVTDVRVQRVQKISEADAVAEGVEAWLGYHDEDVFKNYGAGLDFSGYGAAKNSFNTLWNTLHGPDAWDANPWVAAVTFTVRKGNIDKEPTDG